MKLERVFYPIGHGAFYVERFYMDGNSCPAFTVVFDCGCYNKSPLNTYISRINEIVQKAFSENKTVDILFISHFHTDHIDGISELLQCCEVKRIIVPQLSEIEKIELFVEGLLQTEEDDIENTINIFQTIQEALYEHDNVIEIAPSLESKDEFHQELVDLDTNTNNKTYPSGTCLSKQFGDAQIWTYTPFNPPIKQRAAKLNHALRRSSVFNTIFTTSGNDKVAALADKIRAGHLSDLREVFRKAFNDKHNEYSMTVLSSCGKQCHQPCEKSCHKAINAQNRYCTLNCLYMGDFQPDNDNLPPLMKVYDNLRYVGILQVPHHGSVHNYDQKLYQSPRICIVSADSIDRFGHPDNNTISGIVNNKGIVILVTENEKSKQRFVFQL